MNILHLKYALEVEKTRSINKAAEALFMGQPNLSRAIKDLEEAIGITIFQRSSKGMVPTPNGEEFLNQARTILEQLEQFEAMYSKNYSGKLSFKISVPRASYIAQAFTEFVKLYADSVIEFHFRETNSFRTIKNILENNYNLGIIRFQSANEKYYTTLLKEKGLAARMIWEFEHLILLSREHPLAKKEELEASDLSDSIEIAHGDPYIPYVPQAEVNKEAFGEQTKRRILVYERASQFELLSSIQTSYMWVSSIPKHLLTRYGLVLKKCSGKRELYKDLLLYKKNYKLTELEESFIQKIHQIREAVAND